MFNHNGAACRMLMTVLFVLSFQLNTLAISAQHNGEEGMRSPLEFKLWTDRRVYRQGDEIPIHFWVKNISRKDVLVRKMLLVNGSPSSVEIEINPVDGHQMIFTRGAVEGQPSGDLLTDTLEWCLSLSPGYTYGSTVLLQEIVVGEGLTPGRYRIRGHYVTSGADGDVYFNPLRNSLKERPNLKAKDWSGEVSSESIVITISK